MILSETKAMPIVDLLIDNAIEKIKEATNIEMEKDALLYDLSDCDWCYSVNIDDEENRIDITRLAKTLDYIVERNIKWTLDEINDEMENNENVNF